MRVCKPWTYFKPYFFYLTPPAALLILETPHKAQIITWTLLKGIQQKAQKVMPANDHWTTKQSEPFYLFQSETYCWSRWPVHHWSHILGLVSSLASVAAHRRAHQIWSKLNEGNAFAKNVNASICGLFKVNKVLIWNIPCKWEEKLNNPFQPLY